ncbi:InlB B-repeat-containing protein [Butyrivibrio sp. FCS014]|uniref:InlB B-repeat-containing protein n=1 Tax=Butyrivibrio sp. FCS014 TaxID=1408304 RepID=UPI0004677EC4|nr:InlB B-repeat-containing protein [Butyrivibrio sp. FCS014]
MLKKWNRFLAFVLAFVLVVTTFGSDFASTRAYAMDAAEIEAQTDETNDAEGNTWSEIVEETNGKETAPPAEQTFSGNEAQASGAAQSVEGSTEEVQDPEQQVNKTEEEQAEDGDDEEASDEETEEVADDATDEATDEDATPEEGYLVVKYSTNGGGSVSPKSEKIALDAEKFELKGSTAEAEEGYKFIRWEDEDGEFITDEPTFVPAVPEKEALEAEGAKLTYTYTAVFAENKEEKEEEDAEGPTYNMIFKDSTTVDGIQISFFAAKDVLPDDVYFTVDTLSSKEEAQIADMIEEDLNADTEAEIEVQKTISFDINFFAKSMITDENPEGKVQPQDGTVRVTFDDISKAESDVTSSDTSLAVYHVEDDMSGVNQEKVLENNTTNAIVIDAKHFSTYTVAVYKSGSNSTYASIYAVTYEYDPEDSAYVREIDTGATGNELQISAKQVKTAINTIAPKINGYTYNHAGVVNSQNTVTRITHVEYTEETSGFWLWTTTTKKVKLYDGNRALGTIPEDSQIFFFYTNNNITTDPTKPVIRKTHVDMRIPDEEEFRKLEGKMYVYINGTPYPMIQRDGMEDNCYEFTLLDINVSTKDTVQFEFRTGETSAEWKRTKFYEYEDFVKAAKDCGGKTGFDFYAKYDEFKYSFDVRYDPNGGNGKIYQDPNSSSGSSTQQETSRDFTVLDYKTNNNVKFTREGYTLIGWNRDKASADRGQAETFTNNKITVLTGEPVVMYAVWSSKQYTVTYEGNGHTGGSTSSQTFTYPGKVNIKNNGFTKNGYDFAGWNTKKDGTGTSYGVNAEYGNAADLTLYATWTARTDTAYVVRHWTQKAGRPSTPENDTNYGIYKTDRLKGTSDTKVTPAVLTITGFTSPAAKEVTIAADGTTVVDYYYKGISYTVTYEGNGHTGGSTSSQEFTYPGKVNIRNNGFTKKGYDFAGWNTKKDGTGTSYGVNAEYGNAANLTLYATWTARTDTAYVVRHWTQKAGRPSTPENDTNYGIYKTDSLKGTSDTKVTPAVLTITGFTSPAAKEVTIAADGTTVVDYYYKGISYTVTYEGNGHTGGSTSSQEFTYPGKVNIRNNGFTKKGYDFAGWNTKKDGTGASYGVNAEYGNAANLTLYATWTARTDTAYVVRHWTQKAEMPSTPENDTNYGIYKTDSLKGTSDTKVTPAVLTITGFTSPAAKEVTIAADGTTVVDYYYKGISYTVTYEGNGHTGGSTSSQEFTYPGKVNIRNNGFTKKGYDFAGWNTKKDGTGASYGVNAEYGNAANLTLYATWTARTDTAYVVRHWTQKAGRPSTPENDTNYGIYKTDSLKGTSDTKVTPAVLTITGFTSPAAKEVTIAADGTTVVDYYYKGISYTVTYEGNGHTGGSTSSQEFTYPGKVNIRNNGFTKKGYDFAGWNTKKDGTGASYGVNAEYGNAANLTLYATWTARTDTAYVVRHWTQKAEMPSTPENDTNYGIYQTDRLTGTSDTKVTPAVLTITGFTSPAAKEVTIAADGTTVVDYYYKGISYTVTYEGNGHTGGSTSSQEFTYPGKVNIRNNGFTKKGYDFAGWNTKKDGTGTSYGVNAEYGNAANLTLYATWTARTDTAYVVRHWTQKAEMPSTPENDTNYGIYQTDRLTGTSDTKVTPAVLTITGFTSPAAKEVTIAADGTTVVDYYYKGISYTVTYEGNGHTGGSTSSQEFTYPGKVNIRNNGFTKKGYDFAGWNTKKDGTGTSYGVNAEYGNAANLTLYATWTARTDTAYVVRHWTQKAGRPSTPENDTNYGIYKTDSLKGTSDTKVTPAVLTITGFTSPAAKEVTIAADGTTVVDYYYKGISYTVTYEGNGHTGGSTSSQEFTYPGKVNIRNNGFTKKGYDFAGWNTKKDGTGASYGVNAEYGNAANLTLYATWTARTDTAYVVRHWTQKAGRPSTPENDTNYGIYKTDSLKGTSDTKVTPAVLTITGFTSPAAKEVTIAADGTTVVDYYYKGISYTVTYEGNGHTGGSTSSQEFTYPGKVNIRNNGFTKKGYDFAGWNTKKDGTGASYGVNAEYGNAADLTLYATWTARTDTAYVVRHWTQKLNKSATPENDTNYENYQTDSLTGTSDAKVTPAVLTITGFTSPAAKEVTIAADGTTVVDYYYTRNKYYVTYSYTSVPERAVPNPAQSELTRMQYEYGAVVKVNPKATADGFDFTGWYTSVETQDAEKPILTQIADYVRKILGQEVADEDNVQFTMPDYNVDLYGYFTIKEHTVTFDWQNDYGNQTKTFNVKHWDLTPTAGDGFDMARPESPSTQYFVKWVDEEGIEWTASDLGAMEVLKDATYTAVYEDKTVIKLAAAAVDTQSFAKTYDGTPLVASYSVIEGKVKKGHSLDVKYVEVVDGVEGTPSNQLSITDAGSKSFMLKADVVDGAGKSVIEQYTLDEGSVATLKINKRFVALRASDDTKKFDGTPLVKSSYKIEEGSFAKYTDDGTDVDEFSGLEVYVKGSQTFFGSSKNVITSWNFKEGTFNAENYDVDLRDGDLVVTELEGDDKFKLYVKLDIDGNGKNTDSMMYDGAEHELPVSIILSHEITDEKVHSVDLPGYDDPVVEDQAEEKLAVLETATEDSGDIIRSFLHTMAHLGVLTVYALDEDISDQAAPETESFQIEKGIKETKINDSIKYGDGDDVVTFDVTGIKIISETGIDAGLYETKLDTSEMKITLNGENVAKMFDVQIVTPEGFEGTSTIGTMTVTKRDVKLTSDSGTKTYDGTPLTKPTVHVSGSGFVDGEITNLRATGSVTDVGPAVVNKIAYEFSAEKYINNEALFLNNYDIEISEGSLAITAVPSNDPTPIPDDPTPLAAMPAGAVLGAQRELEGNGAAVLGARRGRTADETTNAAARLLAIIVSAAVAISLMFKGKKKEDEA